MYRLSTKRLTRTACPSLETNDSDLRKLYNLNWTRIPWDVRLSWLENAYTVRPTSFGARFDP